MMANDSICDEEFKLDISSRSDCSSDEDQQFRVPTLNLRQKTPTKGRDGKKKPKKSKVNGITSGESKSPRKRLQRQITTEIASDKNIATLLRSEQLSEYIKSGSQIPKRLAYNISKKTGFRSVEDLNDYITAHRNKFTVLVDRKERHCQSESAECNSFRRSDSVDLQLYFAHHFGSPNVDMNVTV